MSLQQNPIQDLFVHVVDVAHGDAIILELPSYRADAPMGRYAIVDTGRPEKAYRGRVTNYLKTLIDLRNHGESQNPNASQGFEIEFVCITHPHSDHFGGLSNLLNDKLFDGRIRQFWDCGFRTTSLTYNRLLERIAADDRIVYERIAAGFECELGDVRVSALAPSLDLRNRFDTFGVDRNNASVVLRIQHKRSIAILAGDAYLESWGKILEEFPRRTKITYARGASPQRSEGVNQLNCQLLKAAHHGSKHGTNLEVLEKLTPTHVAVTCASPAWYASEMPNWGTDWPHEVFDSIVRALPEPPLVWTSGRYGNLVFRMSGGGRLSDPRHFEGIPDPKDVQFRGELNAAIQ